MDPTTDYPPHGNVAQAPGTSMFGMPVYTNVEGIHSFWTDYWYQYADTPSCPTCGSNLDMDCEGSLCVANSFQDRKRRKKRQAVVSTRKYVPTYRNATYDTNRPSYCRTNPYGRGCPRPKPTTAREAARYMLLGRYPLIDEYGGLRRRVRDTYEEQYQTPPVYYGRPFEVALSYGDCACGESSLYDSLTEYIEYNGYRYRDVYIRPTKQGPQNRG